MVDVGSAVLGSCLTIASGLLVAIYTSRFQRSQAREARLHDLRRQTYTILFDHLYRALDVVSNSWTPVSGGQAPSTISRQDQFLMQAQMSVGASRTVKKMVEDYRTKQQTFLAAGRHWNALTEPGSTAVGDERMAAWEAIDRIRQELYDASDTIEEQVTQEMESRG